MEARISIPICEAGPSVEGMPERLTERPQWVCWRLEERQGEPTKVPYTPGREPERRASPTDLMTWRTFEEAVEAYESGGPGYEGIGFVFCSADPFVGIDLDDCRDPETGEIASWARDIIDSVADSHVEASPSGTGVHIIVEGSMKDCVKMKKVEIYGQDRFFTMTGRTL